MDRNFLYNLADNFIGYDDGVMTPGERAGAGLNALARGIWHSPLGAVGNALMGIKGDLDNLMFEGGARERPEAVLGYAAAPMAPGAATGALLARTPNTLNAIKAWHGSPHDFDKFSMDKIGTGEGAQAYGHGLYFAENEAVARGYRDQLSGDVSTIGEMAVNTTRNPQDAVFAWMNASKSLPSDVRSAVAEKLANRLNSKEILDDLDIDFYGAHNDEVAKILKSNPGRLYEVEIDANPEDFLDWEVGLQQQPQKVREWFDSRGISEGFAGQQSGNELFQAERRAMGDEALAQSLSESGVAGVKYLDHGSRFNAVDGVGPQTNTHNYVVFDENLISIVKKYGIAGAAAMLGLSAAEVEAAMAGGGM